jgi:hypothetical protein
VRRKGGKLKARAIWSGFDDDLINDDFLVGGEGVVGTAVVGVEGGKDLYECELIFRGTCICEMRTA